MIIKVTYKYYVLFRGQRTAWDSVGLKHLPTEKLCSVCILWCAFSNPYEICGSKFDALFI